MDTPTDAMKQIAATPVSASNWTYNPPVPVINWDAVQKDAADALTAFSQGKRPERTDEAI